MKTVTIGRDSGCQIRLTNEQTSRHHALLRISGWDKIEIVDTSTNGTFVNGMRIPSQKPYPVKRSNVVTFAHVERLDWKQVPNPMRTVVSVVIAAVVILVATVSIIFCVNACEDNTSSKYGFGEGGSAPVEVSPKEKKADEKASKSPADKYKKDLKYPERSRKPRKESNKQEEAEKPKPAEPQENNTPTTEDYL